MKRSILRSLTSLLATTTTVLGISVSTANADPIPGYTVTDLGEGTAQVSTDANGDGIVLSPDGQRTYAFPNTDNHLPNPQAVLPLLPPLTNAPVSAGMTYGDPHNAFSYFLTGPSYSSFSFLNQNGVFVGTDNVGVYGHIEAASSGVMASQRQADGSFGPLIPLWGTGHNGNNGGPIAQAMFLNNQNQVLGVGEGFSLGYPERTFILADINSHSAIDLQHMLPKWHLDGAGGLDDQGRILLSADQWVVKEKPGGNGFYSTPEFHSFLLTPEGVSSDPLTVPEPTTLATLMFGLGGLLLGGRRYSRRI